MKTIERRRSRGHCDGPRWEEEEPIIPAWLVRAGAWLTVGILLGIALGQAATR